ncbi:hypothetical protein [Nocardia pseudovaccinii]|uniref:hypothetical protein n=1 Tax=Nocardia pseudovaccinii TaxID=189540 RepID=UPI0007A3AE9A|nr:hypothetical protein [Nocardia pseudovaccinii]
MTFDRGVFVAVLAVAGVELAAVAVDRRLLAVVSGIALATIVVAFAALSMRASGDVVTPPVESPGMESVTRWRARTSVLLQYADGSRGEWDRQVRPLLAREFLLAIGSPEPGGNALSEAGRDFFGPELWRWVDPSAAMVTADSVPGPGRATLGEILERMTRL